MSVYVFNESFHTRVRSETTHNNMFKKKVKNNSIYSSWSETNGVGKYSLTQEFNYLIRYLCIIIKSFYKFS